MLRCTSSFAIINNRTTIIIFSWLSLFFVPFSELLSGIPNNMVYSSIIIKYYNIVIIFRSVIVQQR